MYLDPIDAVVSMSGKTIAFATLCDTSDSGLAGCDNTLILNFTNGQRLIVRALPSVDQFSFEPHAEVVFI